MPNKSEIGGRILRALLNYGKLIIFDGEHPLRIGNYVIKVTYYPLDFVARYSPKKLGSYSSYEDYKKLIRSSNNHALWVKFRGRLEFYKDFSMCYIFTKKDGNTEILRSIQERQNHHEDLSYWTTTATLPLTEEKIHSMLYEAINIAFGYNHNIDKFEKLIHIIEMKSVREV